MPSFPETPFILRTKQAHLAAVHHRAPGKKLVIMCHGFTGQKVETGRLFVQAARVFRQAGLNVVRFDFMGSGDSSGDFQQMTPGTQIQDALDVLAWGQKCYTKVAMLGFSYGGATSILASHAAGHRPDALLTWCAVPDLDWWRSSKTLNALDPNSPGKRFWTERLKTSVAEAYVSLPMPRLQIQGDNDLAGFRDRFAAFAPKNDPRVRHVIIPGADHGFSNRLLRRKLFAESLRWLKKQLA